LSHELGSANPERVAEPHEVRHGAVAAPDLDGEPQPDAEQVDDARVTDEREGTA
jgi:hypothetical protein